MNKARVAEAVRGIFQGINRLAQRRKALKRTDGVDLIFLHSTWMRKRLKPHETKSRLGFARTFVFENKSFRDHCSTILKRAWRRERPEERNKTKSELITYVPLLRE